MFDTLLKIFLLKIVEGKKHLTSDKGNATWKSFANAFGNSDIPPRLDKNDKMMHYVIKFHDN